MNTTSYPAIKAFEITLAEVEEADLPLIVKWRNHPENLPFMSKALPVSLHALQIWLRKIRADHSSLPFLVILKNTPVAFMEIKNIDWNNSCAEGGMFLFGSHLAGTGISLRAILSRELLLRKIGIDILISKINVNNEKSKNFCKSFGARYCGQEKNFEVYLSDAAMRLPCLKRYARVLKCEEEFLEKLAIQTG